MSVVQTSIGFPWHVSFKIVGKIVIFGDPSVKSNFVKSKYNWSLLAMVAIRIHVLLATMQEMVFYKGKCIVLYTWELFYVPESKSRRPITKSTRGLAMTPWPIETYCFLLTVQLISRANQSTYFFQNQYWLITSSISGNWDHYMV